MRQKFLIRNFACPYDTLLSFYNSLAFFLFNFVCNIYLSIAESNDNLNNSSKVGKVYQISHLNMLT